MLTVSFLFGFKKEVHRPTLCIEVVWKDAVAKLIVLCIRQTDLYIAGFNTTFVEEGNSNKIILLTWTFMK